MLRYAVDIGYQPGTYSRYCNESEKVTHNHIKNLKMGSSLGISRVIKEKCSTCMKGEAGLGWAEGQSSVGGEGDV